MKILKISALFVFSVIFSLFVIVLLEIISSVLVKNDNDRLQDILRLLEQDSVLFWKQKSHLNTEFQKHKVVTNSIGFRTHEIQDKKKLRIICLGASPTFGYGVSYEDTYPAVTENILKKNDTDAEVINAGEIGYSSYQGLNLLKTKILDLKPDIITVSYVINDIDKYRFFRSSSEPDSRLQPLSGFVVVISNIIHKSNLFKLINKIIVSNTSKRQQYYGKDYNNNYNENRRVSLQEYEKNLKSFIDIAEENKIKLFFIVMPVNLPVKKALTEQEKADIESLIKDAENRLLQNKYDECKNILSEVLKTDPFYAKANYFLGLVAEKEGNILLADEYFEKAKNFEIFDCAAVSLDYNEIMRKTAVEYSIPFSDCAQEFGKHDNTDYLFVDPEYDCFHPNGKGHGIIADMISEKIINYLKGTENGNE